MFVVNKADMDGADRTVQELREMVQHMAGGTMSAPTGHHAPGVDEDVEVEGTAVREWDPDIVETIAVSGEGIDALADALSDHQHYLEESGELESKSRARFAEEIRSLLRQDVGELLESELEAQGGVDALAERVRARQTDPYSVVDELVEPIEECLDDR